MSAAGTPMMQRRTVSHLLLASLVFAASGRSQAGPIAAEESADEAALRRTREGIGAAFRRGDVTGVLAYHHPEIRKALGYDHVVAGHAALAAELTASFAQAIVEFPEDIGEDLLIRGDTAFYQARFAARVTPKAGGEAAIYRGRTQMLLIRYPGSPSGWAMLREMIQAQS